MESDKLVNCDLPENSGDPWLEFSAENRAEPGSFDYLDAIWFLMVTCSTVGYGDVSPRTVLGKIAVMFFLCSKFLLHFLISIVLSLKLVKKLELVQKLN